MNLVHLFVRLKLQHAAMKRDNKFKASPHEQTALSPSLIVLRPGELSLLSRMSAGVQNEMIQMITMLI